MTDRPHRFDVRSSDDRALAAALLTQPAVFGVELVGDLLAVRTSEFGAFSAIIAPVARQAGVRLYEVTPTDDSLESVFSYLVRR
jgi:ABC-2 type transport system ATP-binding protein